MLSLKMRDRWDWKMGGSRQWVVARRRGKEPYKLDEVIISLLSRRTALPLLQFGGIPKGLLSQILSSTCDFLLDVLRLLLGLLEGEGVVVT